MIGRELPTCDVEAIARIVRALGTHRYVAGRLHLVHALALDAVAETDDLAAAKAWARGVLEDRSIDRGSRDERLVRACTDRELAAVLAGFWSADAGPARDALERHLRAIDAPALAHARFDEAAEEDIFPLLVDAGWELLPIAALDPERHKGVLDALDDVEVARFEEESAIDPVTYLQELPAIGPVELLHGAADGALAVPLTLWTEGPDAYHDYVIRGVLRAARVTT